jgi:hypothetical protein
VAALVHGWHEAAQRATHDKKEGSSFHMAARGSARAATIDLLAAVWPAGIRESTGSSGYPLHVAAEHGSVETVQALLRHAPEVRRREIAHSR